MKSVKTILAVFFILLSVFSESAEAQIHCKLNCGPNELVNLGAYEGTRIVRKDSALTNVLGEVVFNIQNLNSGLYSVVTNSSTNYDFLFVKRSKLDIELNSALGLFKVEGNAQTEAFNRYRNTIISKNGRKAKLSQRFKQNQQNNDSIAIIRAQLIALDRSIKQYYAAEVQKNRGTFYGDVMLLIAPVLFNPANVPAFELMPSNKQQQIAYGTVVKQYMHQLKTVNSAVLNTPFYESKLQGFVNNVLIQIPDTISKYGFELIKSQRNQPEYFKYLTNYFFKYAINSKVMGIDAFLVELSKRYYLNGQATWVDDKFMAMLKRRVAITEPTLIGKVAPELVLQSWVEQEGFHELHKQQNKYTILVFWEPDCSFCKQALPLINKVYQKYATEGVGVYAVNTMYDYKPWVDYIVNSGLTDWVHVYDKDKANDYKSNYDISGTPVIYVLDADSKIKAKKIPASILDELMGRLLKNGSIY